ncbi:MAG: tRNA (guanine(10)-N(2))-dimethyltransferase [archaeon]|nr:tRNA (guanine(10)-N(2))-dimethyltransferase [archaeon]
MCVYEQSIKIVEGKTTLLVPKVSIESDVPPKMPAFYNPQAKLNRDLSIFIYKAMARRLSGHIRMADSLAGIGARGVRVAVESPEIGEVFMNDLNPVAIDYAKASAKMNEVYDKCSFSIMDACHFLIEHSSPRDRFEIVDIDHFGSPAPYLDCAVRAVRDKGLISITATDTAVLCGIYPKVSARKYFGYSLNTEYCHEIGIRLLLGALAHSAMRLDIGINPLFSHSTRHYIRIYATISSGASYADETRDSLGYILHCFNCFNRKISSTIEKNCDECGEIFRFAGLLWIKEIHDKNFLSYLLNNIDLNKECEKMIRNSLNEADMPPTYYIPDKIADKLQLNVPKLNYIINSIKDKGYRATRSAINSKGIKTDAPSSVIIEIIKELNR